MTPRKGTGRVVHLSPCGRYWEVEVWCEHCGHCTCGRTFFGRFSVGAYATGEEALADVDRHQRAQMCMDGTPQTT